MISKLPEPIVFEYNVTHELEHGTFQSRINSIIDYLKERDESKQPKECPKEKCKWWSKDMGCCLSVCIRENIPYDSFVPEDKYESSEPKQPEKSCENCGWFGAESNPCPCFDGSLMKGWKPKQPDKENTKNINGSKDYKFVCTDGNKEKDWKELWKEAISKAELYCEGSYHGAGENDAIDVFDKYEHALQAAEKRMKELEARAEHSYDAFNREQFVRMKEEKDKRIKELEDMNKELKRHWGSISALMTTVNIEELLKEKDRRIKELEDGSGNDKSITLTIKMENGKFVISGYEQET